MSPNGEKEVFMKKLLLVFVATLLVSAPAFAGDVELAGKMDNDHGVGKGGFHHGWCNLKLTDEQKEKMRAEHFKFEEAKIDLESQLKHSRLALKKVVSDPSSDYRAAKAAAEEVSRNRNKLFSAKEAAHLEIMFKVFTAEQRAEALKCGGFRHQRRGGFRGGFGNRRAEGDDLQTLSTLSDERVPGSESDEMAE
jgi:Spy/CpxP family protein refolding chaperone